MVVPVDEATVSEVPVLQQQAQQQQAIDAAGQAVLPSYQPSEPLPLLSSTLATAQAPITRVINQVNLDIDQADSLIQQAYALANKANQTARCAQPANPPATLKYIAPASSSQ